MGTLLKILFWFSICLLSLLPTLLLATGRSNLLRHAANVKPYAVCYSDLEPPAYRSEAADGWKSLNGDLIIFFGDSSVAPPPWAQPGSTRIPVLLQDCLTSSPSALPQVRVVDWSFAGARLFHYYCLLFEAEKNNSSLVVIPINWRSIGPLAAEWSRLFAFPELSSLAPITERAYPSCRTVMRLEGISLLNQRLYRFHRPLLFLTGLKMCLVSRITEDSSVSPTQIAVLELFPPGEHVIERYSDGRLFTQYANTIPPESASMQVLHSIVETATRRRLKTLFYIVPIHVDEMRERVSFDAVSFDASLQRIVRATTSDVTACLDLSDLLHEDDFLDNYEHYTPPGNRAIAEALAPAAMQLLTDDCLASEYSVSVASARSR